jgi:hypothetical protein
MELNSTEIIAPDCYTDNEFSSAHPTIKLRFSLAASIIIYLVYLLPFCFGVFGNISVCLIFFQQRKLRSITNTFLMNLCKSKFYGNEKTRSNFVHWFYFQGLNDLIVLCVSIPITLSAALLEHWIFGEFLCKFLYFTPTLTALVSTFTVATIAVERWFFIVNKKKFDRCCTLITLMLLWTVSILIALPEFLSRYLQEFAPSMSFPTSKSNTSSEQVNQHFDTSINLLSKTSCQTKKIYFCVFNPGLRMRIFSYIVITVQYLVPFLFVSISCYSISRFLKGRMKHMRNYQMHNRSKNTTHMKHNVDGHEQTKQTHVKQATEQEVTTYEKVPTTIITNENAVECSHRVHYQDSLVINRPSYRSSSIVGTVLMSSEKNQSHSKRRFHRSRKLLICVAALFTISWLPLTVVQIYLEHNEEITHNEPNFVYGFLLIPCYLISSLSAWMNPIIYNYINRSFRREFYALYPCCYRLATSVSSSSMNFRSNRTQLPSIMKTKSTRQQDLRSTVENLSMPIMNSKRKLGTRVVSFADRNGNGKASLVLFNEQT